MYTNVYILCVCLWSYTPFASFIDVCFNNVLVAKVLLWKSVEHEMKWCVGGWLAWVYMQSATYTTELFLPGTWLLYPTALSASQSKLSTVTQPLKDMVFLLPLAPPAKIWIISSLVVVRCKHMVLSCGGPNVGKVDRYNLWACMV